MTKIFVKYNFTNLLISRKNRLELSELCSFYCHTSFYEYFSLGIFLAFCIEWIKKYWTVYSVSLLLGSICKKIKKVKKGLVKNSQIFSNLNLTNIIVYTFQYAVNFAIICLFTQPQRSYLYQPLPFVCANVHTYTS